MPSEFLSSNDFVNGFPTLEPIPFFSLLKMNAGDQKSSTNHKDRGMDPVSGSPYVLWASVRY